MRLSLTLPDKTYKIASKLAKELGSSISSVLRLWIHKGMIEPVIKTTKKIPMSERIKHVTLADVSTTETERSRQDVIL